MATVNGTLTPLAMLTKENNRDKQEKQWDLIKSSGVKHMNNITWKKNQISKLADKIIVLEKEKDKIYAQHEKNLRPVLEKIEKLRQRRAHHQRFFFGAADGDILDVKSLEKVFLVLCNKYGVKVK